MPPALHCCGSTRMLYVPEESVPRLIVPVAVVQLPVPTWVVEGLGPVTVMLQAGVLGYVPLVQWTVTDWLVELLNLIFAF